MTMNEVLKPASEAVSSDPVRRDRSITARRKARGLKGVREQQIVNLLNSGVSVAEIAQSQGVTHRRMRMVVAEILARRAPQRQPNSWPCRSVV
jgi:DNA-binding NarL/FixJ family response regulator